MDVSMIKAASAPGLVPGSPVTSRNPYEKIEKTGTFGDVLHAAMNVVNETNALQVNAQNEEVRFALGEADNPHDLMIAQQKALVALQYTVAVRDRFIQGYQEIMNMQI